VTIEGADMTTKDSVVRILVADDSDLIRSGLCSVLQSRPGWVVCGEATDGKEALEKAIRLKPDVILVDISMPHLNGFEVYSRTAPRFRSIDCHGTRFQNIGCATIPTRCAGICHEVQS
jgi:DNA-binding NarL/FixJ family response regulator